MTDLRLEHPDGIWREPAPLRGVARLDCYPWLIVGTVCIGAFMGQLDASIAQLVLPEVGREFHASIGATAWVSISYLLVAAAMLPVFGRLADMVGRKLLYCGGFLVFASLHYLAETERATVSNAVPTVWLGVLQHMRDTGGKLTTLRRIACGGSAVPEALFNAYAEYGTTIMHAWGMTEMSPLGVANQPNAATAALPPDEAAKLQLKQGRGVWGAEMKITDADGKELPWDGVAFGDVYVRGPRICREYYRRGAEAAADAGGWFATAMSAPSTRTAISNWSIARRM